MDRKDFKGTPTKQLKKIVEVEDTKVSSGKSSDYLKIEEGLNKIRIFPKHPGEENFYKVKGQHWLTIENDEGKEVRRTVSNARVTANAKKDIIEQYIEFCKKNLDAKDVDDKDKITQLTAYEGGLGLQTTWLCYAKKMSKSESQFGLLELKKSIRDKMNQEAFVEEDDEALEIDPFTDPDEGRPILVKYDKKPKSKKASDMYITTLSKNVSPLSDEEIEMFATKTPLSQLPQFQYGSNEFELALEGLRFFDEKHDINLFDTDEFQEIVTELSELYGSKTVDEDEEEEDEKPKSKKKVVEEKSSKKVIKKKVEEDEDTDDEEEEDEKPAKKVVKKVIKPTKKVVEDEDEDLEDEDLEDEDDDDEEEEDEKPIKKQSSASFDDIKKKLDAKKAGKK